MAPSTTILSPQKRSSVTIVGMFCTTLKTTFTVSYPKTYNIAVQYSAVPTLRVGETLDFVAKTRMQQQRLNNLSRKDLAARKVHLALSVFGLGHAEQTAVGDAAVRGVSGGEKKRVSLSEALISAAPITAWDNSTRGLDSSTALEFAQALRTMTDTLQQTNIVSLYQAGENIYQLFDKVCVIYEGRMVYFGPTSRARCATIWSAESI